MKHRTPYRITRAGYRLAAFIYVSTFFAALGCVGAWENDALEPSALAVLLILLVTSAATSSIVANASNTIEDEWTDQWDS